MIFCGNRVFADVSKLRWGHTKLGWALIQYEERVPKLRENTAMRKWRQRLELYCQQIRRCLGLPEAGQSEEGSCPTGCRGSMAPPITWFTISNLHNHERTIFFVVSQPAQGTLLWQPWKLIQLRLQFFPMRFLKSNSFYIHLKQRDTYYVFKLNIIKKLENQSNNPVIPHVSVI